MTDRRVESGHRASLLVRKTIRCQQHPLNACSFMLSVLHERRAFFYRSVGSSLLRCLVLVSTIELRPGTNKERMTAVMLRADGVQSRDEQR